MHGMLTWPLKNTLAHPFIIHGTRRDRTKGSAALSAKPISSLAIRTILLAMYNGSSPASSIRPNQ